jgi:hypothetical protein
VIRNAVIHLNNEQPLVADLFELPGPTDQGLRCTNLRTLSGQRPVFADRIESVFYFPYAHIRFVEMPPEAAALAGSAAGGAAPIGLDDSLLLNPAPGDHAPATIEAEVDPEPELEIDEDFLRRIREV